MITEKEYESIRTLAAEGREHPDSNANFHAEILASELQRYNGLVLPHAKEKREKEVRFRARQVKRIIGSRDCRHSK